MAVLLQITATQLLFMVAWCLLVQPHQFLYILKNYIPEMTVSSKICKGCK